MTESARPVSATKQTRRALLASSAAPAILRGAAKKRNIVLIYTDDQRFDVMGCAGHPWIKTPNLDRLAREGAMFNNSFVTTSLCSPSRASILTGMYAHGHGVTDNFTKLPPGLPTFPQLLQRQGYRTAFIGKWHLGDEELAGGATPTRDDPQPGFDRWVSFPAQGVYRNPPLNMDGKRVQAKGYMTDILTAESCKFIRENKSRPFMLCLPHKGVHALFEPAERHKDLYSTDPVPVPKSAPDRPETTRDKPEWVLKKRRVSHHGLDHLYDGRLTLEQLYRQYCRCLQSVDESVGEILNTLDEGGLLNDTLFVFTSDNGYMMGEQGLIDKRVMYEPSIRVPLLARCPDMFGGGRRIDQLALNIDIAPTLLDTAGVTAPRTVHGKSWLPLLKGSSQGWRTDFLYEYFWDWQAPHTPTIMGLRSEDYSFIETTGVWDITELYDVRSDPDQLNNLLTGQRGYTWQKPAKDPKLAEMVATSKRRIEALLQETGGRRFPGWAL